MPVPQIQEQVIVQGIPGAQVVERIQEQIAETIAEVPQERAQQPPVEQIVRVPVPTVQEQMIVQEIPRAQVVKRIRVNIVETIPQERVQQRTVEQIVPVPFTTVQKQMCVPVKSGAQVMERIPEHIVESLDRGAWSVATRLVDGSIRTSGFLMMLSLIAAPRLLIHVYGSAICLQSLLERNVGTRSLGDPQPSQDSGRKLIVRVCCLAPWDNAKKYISAGDLEPDQDKKFRHAQENCDRTPSEIPWTDTFGPALWSMKLTAIFSIVFGSAIVAHRIPTRSILNVVCESC